MPRHLGRGFLDLGDLGVQRGYEQTLGPQLVFCGLVGVSVAPRANATIFDLSRQIWQLCRSYARCNPPQESVAGLPTTLSETLIFQPNCGEDCDLSLLRAFLSPPFCVFHLLLYLSFHALLDSDTKLSACKHLYICIIALTDSSNSILLPAQTTLKIHVHVRFRSVFCCS